MKCGCDQDPEFHRDLNARRNKAEEDDKCTNYIHPDNYPGQGGICLACIFGCFE